MTTDEIAAAVQAGEADILELWRAVERFVWKMARRKIASLDGKRGVDVFDLAQVGFISMLEALNRFDAAKGGSFIGQLSMSLKTGFAEATGSRTARAFNEPLDMLYFLVVIAGAIQLTTWLFKLVDIIERGK